LPWNNRDKRGKMEVECLSLIEFNGTEEERKRGGGIERRKRK